MQTLDVVRDHLGRDVILIERVRPAGWWLEMQDDPRMREPGLAFWHAIPLTGGSVAVNVPEEHCEFLRKATEDDIEVAVANNEFAKSLLMTLYVSHLVDDVDDPSVVNLGVVHPALEGLFGRPWQAIVYEGDPIISIGGPVWTINQSGEIIHYAENDHIEIHTLDCRCPGCTEEA